MFGQDHAVAGGDEQDDLDVRGRRPRPERSAVDVDDGGQRAASPAPGGEAIQVSIGPPGPGASTRRISGIVEAVLPARAERRLRRVAASPAASVDRPYSSIARVPSVPRKAIAGVSPARSPGDGQCASRARPRPRGWPSAARRRRRVDREDVRVRSAAVRDGRDDPVGRPARTDRGGRTPSSR